jgi:FG-GAP-like repeat
MNSPPQHDRTRQGRTRKHSILDANTKSRRRFVWTVLFGLSVTTITGLSVWRSRTRNAEFGDFANQIPVTLATTDEIHICEVCSHCHQLPRPNVLPRDAWQETIWQMFEYSGYGTTVKWRVAPEVLVAWFEENSLKQFAFPDVQDSLDKDRNLRLTKRLVNAKEADAPAVVANIITANLVGNERPEIVVCDMLNNRVLMGRTDKAQWRLEPIAQVANPAHAEAVDLDSDGLTDLVVAGLGSFLAMDHNLGSVEWLRQTDEGTFDRQTLADGFGRVADVQPDDFDGDGDTDLVVAEFGWHVTGHLLLLENRSQSGMPVSFVRRDIDGLHGASHVDVTDLDGDGLHDIVVLYSQGHEMVRGYLQREGFTFEIEDMYRAPSPAWGFSGMQLVDLDSDGDVDVLLSNGDTFDNNLIKPYHGIQWLENKGLLKFEPHELGTLYGAYRAEAADMDGDGDLDVVACALIAPESDDSNQFSGKLDSIVWFEQESPEQFVRHTLETGPCHHPTLTLSDYDLDGDTDLLVGNGQLQFTEVPTDRACIEIWENVLETQDNSL